MEISVESMIRRSNEAKESGKFFEALQYAQTAYSLCPQEDMDHHVSS
ncbi:MAG: hypothetical protein KRP56_03190 [Candidatus Methanogranum gryphiswaldense]|nr:MAG: hypothetical protein KRP56_03190 [Candidatus Methanogranum sp. U3.2.1]